jgi:hypothetical protein
LLTALTAVKLACDIALWTFSFDSAVFVETDRMTDSFRIQQEIVPVETLAHRASGIRSADDAVGNQCAACDTLDCFGILGVADFLVDLERASTRNVHNGAVITRKSDAVLRKDTKCVILHD